MARKTETTTIEGVQFRVSQLGFAASRALFVRLAKRLGPTLAALANGAGSLAALDLVKVASQAVEALDEGELQHLDHVLEDVAQFSRTGREWPHLGKDNREALFSDLGVLAYFRFLAFALETQYGDFSEALRSRESDPEGATRTGSPASTRS